MKLEEIVAYLKENPKVTITVIGHADKTEQDYLRLSEKRADYVINYLKQKGNPSLKIVKLFLGKSKPIAGNSTTEGQSLNRRVEIKITK